MYYAKMQYVMENVSEKKRNLLDMYLLELRIQGRGFSQHEQNVCYLFYNPATVLYKVGISTVFNKRYRDIRNTCGSEIEIVAFIDLEMHEDEHPKVLEDVIHRYYKTKRRIGEWFELNPRDIFDIVCVFHKAGGNHLVDNVREHLMDVYGLDCIDWVELKQTIYLPIKEASEKQLKQALEFFKYL